VKAALRTQLKNVRMDTDENRENFVTAFRKELKNTCWTIPPAIPTVVFDMVKEGTYPVKVVEVLPTGEEPAGEEWEASEEEIGEPERCNNEGELPDNADGGVEGGELGHQREEMRTREVDGDFISRRQGKPDGRAPRDLAEAPLQQILGTLDQLARSVRALDKRIDAQQNEKNQPCTDSGWEIRRDPNARNRKDVSPHWNARNAWNPARATNWWLFLYLWRYHQRKRKIEKEWREEGKRERK
jgi:hypothetical protein